MEVVFIAVLIIVLFIFMGWLRSIIRDRKQTETDTYSALKRAKHEAQVRQQENDAFERKMNKTRQHLIAKAQQQQNVTTKFVAPRVTKALSTVKWPWDITDVSKEALIKASQITPFAPISLYDTKAEFVSNETGEIYVTRLSSCTCRGFRFTLRGKRPCKHIIALALSQNIIDQNGNLCESKCNCVTTTTSSPYNPQHNKIANISATGKKFAFCGRMQTFTQAQAAIEVRKFGGTQTTPSKADILVVGSKPAAKKILEASKSGALLISETDFIKMLK